MFTRPKHTKPETEMLYLQYRRSIFPNSQDRDETETFQEKSRDRLETETTSLLTATGMGKASTLSRMEHHVTQQKMHDMVWNKQNKFLLACKHPWFKCNPNIWQKLKCKEESSCQWLWTPGIRRHVKAGGQHTKRLSGSHQVSRLPHMLIAEEKNTNSEL